MRASVIIPAYQASATVAQTVRAVRSIPGVAEVIVVDDGSLDGTAEAARRAGADQVIALPRNQGKGAALRAGLESARHNYLLFLDADLGHSAAQAGPLLQAIPNHTAMAVASLSSPPGPGGLGLARGLARATIRLLTGLRVAAPLSGQRAVAARLVRHVGLAPRFGVEVGLTVEAAHLGASLLEVPLPLEHRESGRTPSGFLHRARQFRDVLQFLLLTGYGLGWPALSRGRTAGRAVVWLMSFALLLELGSLAPPGASARLALISAAAALGWLPLLWISGVSLGLRKANYLGRKVPAAAGLLFPVVGLPSLWFSPLAAPVRAAGLVVTAALAAVGLLDDLFSSGRQARGLRGHLLTLARGRLTTGTVKALAGLAAGLGAGCLLHPGQPASIVLDALLIALAANLVNLLDLRPGRGLKGFGLLCVLTMIFSSDSLHLVGPLLAAALVSAPADFAGRAMMGDVGANVLGGVAGLALAITLGPWARLAVVLVLAAMHLICERASLSDLIMRSRLLSYCDRLGTHHLPALPPEEAAPS